MSKIKPLDCLVGVRECALKLLEEASEACEAMKAYDKTGNYSLDALRELADVEQCVCNCLYSLDACAWDWEDAMAQVQRINKFRGRNEIDSMRSLRVEWRRDGTNDRATCHNVADEYDGDDFVCSNCGEAWEFTCGSPEDNNLNYCPRCGAKIVSDNETD